MPVSSRSSKDRSVKLCYSSVIRSSILVLSGTVSVKIEPLLYSDSKVKSPSKASARILLILKPNPQP